VLLNSNDMVGELYRIKLSLFVHVLGTLSKTRKVEIYAVTLEIRSRIIMEST